MITLALGLQVSSEVQADQSVKEPLRVCADPNNLPYSNRNLQGFENKIAQLLAADLQRELAYTWFPQRMGFVRNTLKAWDDEKGRFLCDLVIGVPLGFDMTDTTRSYYRSTYVIVIKAKGKLRHIQSAQQFAQLPKSQRQNLKIGAFVPSASVDWLNQYGFSQHTRFFQAMTGDADDYPGKIIEEELVPGHLDGVLIWGPIAGYFASQHPEADLRLLPLQSEPGMQFDFAMAMGLRRREAVWKAQLEQWLVDRQAQIMEVLKQYQVPLMEGRREALNRP